MKENKKISDKQFFQLIEGELSKKEAETLLKIIAEDEDLSHEWATWKMTMLIDTEIVFEDKEQLKIIPQQKRGFIVWWSKVAAVAAVLVLGLIGYLMFQHTENRIDSQARLNIDTLKDFKTGDGNNLPYQEKQELAETKLNNTENTKPSAMINPVQKQSSKVKTTKAIAVSFAVNAKDSAPKNIDHTIFSIDTVTKNIAIHSTVMVASNEPVETIYGTKKEKHFNFLKRIKSFKNDIKIDVNEWLEKPQIAVDDSENDRKLSFKNNKIKLSFKP